ncbi:DEAD/DEAH box helicase family protein [Nicoliella spurrieriana]|uniref:DEAD/DEAH box helicase family protein n=1 Tax=Nicoliella spurrieriana TaxID=2925830 RepID=A0A976X5X5_9LACO|nr:helicase-related protein [Nicoliella spurrieriana]UQS86987.1 DEAD/DEAH box helicase family protein [Nicoliella spurrieriana]
MITKINELYGRQINTFEIDAAVLDATGLKTRPAIKKLNGQIECQRCGMRTDCQSSALPGNHFYCPECINLGRMVSNCDLAYANEPNQFEPPNNPLTWQGRLTTDQLQCSNTIIDHFQRRKAHLLWAVTGAGKTEMLFPGIKWALQNRLRIAIASPRVDVCIELFPRIKEAFATTPMILLHGRQSEKYQYSQLTICTTHQLLRFYRAFDILIIDEVDSFPYAQDAGLHYAVDNAIKPDGARLFLTATPSADLLKLVRQKQLSISYLPLRFHRHLLPQIKRRYVPYWREKLTKGKLPRRLIDLVRMKVRTNQRFLLFVPHVRDLKPVAEVLAKVLPDTAQFMTVHSEDPHRLTKVTAMRELHLVFLITTTILERGVTFPGIDVIVLGADEDIFSTPALVQIAGRVGRKADRPFGDVDFFIHSNAKNVAGAVRQIAHMNRLGAQKLNHE